MVKILLVSASLISGLVMFAAVVFFVGVEEIGKGLLEFAPLGAIPLVGLTMIGHVLNTIWWRSILGKIGIIIPFIPLLKIELVGYAGSYITPVALIGGEAVRGYILREQYGVSWSKSVASMGIEKMIEASVLISTIFTGAILFLMQSGISSLPKGILAFIISLVFLGVVVTVVYVSSFQKKSLVPLILKPFGLENSRGGKFLGEVEGEFHVFFSPENRTRIIGILKLVILKYAVLWLRNVFLLYYLLDVFSLGGGVITLGFSYIAYSFPTPAALGVHEGLLSLVFAGMGLGAGHGAVFSLLLRGVDVIIMSAGIFFFLRWGLGRLALETVKRLRLGSFGVNNNGTEKTRERDDKSNVRS